MIHKQTLSKWGVTFHTMCKVGTPQLIRWPFGARTVNTHHHSLVQTRSGSGAYFHGVWWYPDLKGQVRQIRRGMRIK